MKYESNTTLQAILAELGQLSHDEGVVLSIYRDSLGHPTLGCGTLITPDMPEHGLPSGTPVSEARCAELLFAELVEKTLHDGPRVFGDAWDGFPMEAKQVFINFLFNIGATRAAKFVKMIYAAKTSQWNVAAAELLDSRYAVQVGNRATRLADRLRVL